MPFTGLNAAKRLRVPPPILVNSPPTYKLPLANVNAFTFPFAFVIEVAIKFVSLS